MLNNTKSDKNFIFFLCFCLLIIMAIMYGLFAMLYSNGDIFPPKMPANVQELNSWPTEKVWLLYSKTLDCWDLPPKPYDTAEPNEVVQWRHTCSEVRDIWAKKNKQDKMERLQQKAKELNLPN